MIDAGHGGKDQGTSAGNVLEKDLNLQVAEKLAKELKKRGASVLLTRTDDTKFLWKSGLPWQMKRSRSFREHFTAIYCDG